MKYDRNSLKAEEFINDEEINDTVRYANEHKDDLELIDKILEKAKKRKGLDHRDASVLLACTDASRIRKIYDLAEQIKKDFYGNRIVLFAPLYLSNYCVNGCLYCPYHIKNKNIPRKKLTQEEVAKDVIAGKYGTNQARINNLRAAGYDAYAVQDLVNNMVLDYPM